jgi:hypothetical protein
MADLATEAQLLPDESALLSASKLLLTCGKPRGAKRKAPLVATPTPYTTCA